jgi:hypothetical protein
MSNDESIDPLLEIKIVVMVSQETNVAFLMGKGFYGERIVVEGSSPWIATVCHLSLRGTPN